MNADLAQQVEHIHGKDGLSASSPEVGSIEKMPEEETLPVFFALILIFGKYATIFTVIGSSVPITLD